jgi:hypothetical protein
MDTKITTEWHVEAYTEADEKRGVTTILYPCKTLHKAYDEANKLSIGTIAYRTIRIMMVSKVVTTGVFETIKGRRTKDELDT